MAITPNSILHGPRAIFTIRGTAIAYASNAQWSSSYQMTPIQVLGNIEVVQHIPTAYTATLSVNQLRLVNSNMQTLGFQSRIGRTAAEHLRLLANVEELDATIEDQQEEVIIAQFIGLRVEGSSTSVGVNGIMEEQISFTCRRLQTEAET
jgi:hypothetical protein